MAENNWLINGLSFHSKDTYLSAKKEDEAIAYLRKNTDLSNGKNALKVYNKLIEKDTFHTIVGYFFLDELRRIIVIHNIADKNQLKDMPIKDNGNDNKVTGYSRLQMDKELQNYKALHERVVISHRNSRIINLFLVVVIIAMFGISFLIKNTENERFENEVVNKNAKWAEELQQKEDELDEREDLLNQENNK